MNLLNWLAVAIPNNYVIQNAVQLDWIGEIIQSLIKACGSIGLGVIVFTLILKLITLPFDIISRVSTKKNSVMMEKMRPELEKLQRQYSNNAQLYQRKMQDLYKKNGYSPFSACLPTILNLVFFIVVIGQFSTYSHYANLQLFCDMSVAYQASIDEFCDANPDLIIKSDLVDDNGEIYGVERTLNLQSFIGSSYDAGISSVFDFKAEDVKTVNGKQALTLPSEPSQKMLGAIHAELAKGESGILFEYSGYEIVLVENGVYSLTTSSEDLGDFKEKVGTIIAEHYGNKFINEQIKEIGREAAAEEYRANKDSVRFLWVKNVWSQDIPWEHPIKQSFGEYGFLIKSGCFATCGSGCNSDANRITGTHYDTVYNEITANLGEEKEQPNGYLILVLLSIGTMLISQVIAQKQAKTQTELGSVDGANGTAAQSQKMMTWMMPIMFGVFSFMYTASFSIYIIVSSVFSLLSNMLINLAVDKKFARLAAEEAKQLELRRTGKIKEIEKKDKKNKK